MGSHEIRYNNHCIFAFSPLKLQLIGLVQILLKPVFFFELFIGLLDLPKFFYRTFLMGFA